MLKDVEQILIAIKYRYSKVVFNKGDDVESVSVTETSNFYFMAFVTVTLLHALSRLFHERLCGFVYRNDSRKNTNCFTGFVLGRTVVQLRDSVHI